MGNLNLHNWYDRTGLGLPGYPTALHCTAHQIPTVNRVKSWDGNFLGGILKVMKNPIIEPLHSRVRKIFIKKSSPKFVLKIELNGFQWVSSFKSPSILMKVWLKLDLNKMFPIWWEVNQKKKIFFLLQSVCFLQFDQKSQKKLRDI